MLLKEAKIKNKDAYFVVSTKAEKMVLVEKRMEEKMHDILHRKGW